ncbi:acid phosphatase type 7-like [Sycon ciliatum]|uniref:acid phosphatase type 7-like n=1 Tax=Sycon ciliatum TaxID=27933 RepID=UPI0031F6A80E
MARTNVVRVAGLLLLSTLSLLAVDCHERHGIRDDHASVAESEVSADAAEQIHISFGRSTSEIVVVWSSRNSSKTSSVQYGSSSSSSSSPLTERLNVSVAAECWQFTEGNPDGIQWLYRARLQNLSPGKSYNYQISSAPGVVASDVFSFSVPKLLDEAYPMQVVMFGDMGKVGGSATLPRLKEEVKARDNVAMIHVGDFAYDLQDDGGKRGDDFMNRLQDVSANIPYMTCPGNHEIAFNFSHYRNRFAMPSADESPANDQLWWSLDIGPVHFLSYDTEVYFAREDLIQAQLDFINADLARAADPAQRKKVPWIVAFGHRPMYCSNIDNDDCATPKSKVRAGLEATFYKYGVDFIVEGHEHSYERLYPVFNETVTQKNYIDPKAPVHIISGQAGCNEAGGLCVNPILGKKGDWSAFRSWLPGQYGYGRLKFLNATHAQWSQMYDIVKLTEDTVIIEQQDHGPFR